MNVTEDTDKMTGIMRKYFETQTTCVDGSAEISTDSPSLGVYSFGGLFIIAVVASMFSLLIHVVRFLHFHWPTSNIVPPEGSFWLKLIELVKHLGQKDLCSYPFRKNESPLYPKISPDGFGASASIDDKQKHSRTSSEGADNVATDDDDEIL